MHFLARALNLLRFSREKRTGTPEAEKEATEPFCDALPGIELPVISVILLLRNPAQSSAEEALRLRAEYLDKTLPDWRYFPDTFFIETPDMRLSAFTSSGRVQSIIWKSHDSSTEVHSSCEEALNQMYRETRSDSSRDILGTVIRYLP
ncbi:hypothetical protein TH5_00420 [Thalassospira xianhensis MCCC 1A02616]|nr:hypothetical protein TH5_00420 [Thalassospira xianhensis MCCC 1A02616]